VEAGQADGHGSDRLEYQVVETIAQIGFDARDEAQMLSAQTAHGSMLAARARRRIIPTPDEVVRPSEPGH
jgi:hypothetical protein